MNRIIENDISREELLGIEGNAARVYFVRLFNNCKWVSRKPRIRFDYINSLLDIGYNLLFQFIDAVLQVFGFDVYQGVLHTCFYMRKSLVCDVMEPFRPIIDRRVRKGISLKQFKQEDFICDKGRWDLKYQKTAEYVSIFLKDILEEKDAIFLYVRSFYRYIMKEKSIEAFPVYDFMTSKVEVSKGKEVIDDNC